MGRTRRVGAGAVARLGLGVAVALGSACEAPVAAGSPQGRGEEAGERMACRAAEAPVAPAAALDRAVAAMGSRPDGILRYATVEARTQDFQSDRSYPPYFSSFDVQEVRYDPVSAAEHRSREFLYPRMGPGPARRTAVTDSTAYLARQGELVPVESFYGQAQDSRRLNPWAVVEDWAGADGVAAAGECRFRDDWRTVLEREGPYGPDRLLLDRETGFPIALTRLEPHVTWGQREVAWVWSTWLQVAEGSYFPSASFRMDDGGVTVERTVGRMAVVPRSEASLPPLPDAPPMAADPWLERWTAEAPDTARIGGDAFLLTHWGYNEGVVAAGDTVYLLDATVSEARARQDSAWIARLFPGRRHVAVVVTDVAWPHVGGVRFWVARGATVFAHPVSAPLLEEVVARRWELAPDALERRRRAGDPTEPRIVLIDAPTDVGDGALRLVPVEGVGSEGALVAWVPGEDFLWAGDYVQTLERPSMYAQEVMAALAREGLRPERMAAQHVPLSEWARVLRANGGG